MTPDAVDRLRDRLAGFTADAVVGLLGAEAWAALARNETAPGLLVTERDESPLATFVRLFQLQTSVPRALAAEAFGDAFAPLLGDSLLVSELDESGTDTVRAAVDIRPYGDEQHDWWVVCDLTPGLDGRMAPMSPNYVLGISEASSSLARLTVRSEVGSALDLGTGCGVQALHLSTHAQRVVATDVNPRALRMAELTAQLNGIDVDLRNGSLYDPVEAERFDLICTNPPFVVSPPSRERLVYRETGFEGDEVVRRIVRGAADMLNPGGYCQVLASWQITDDEPWDERLSRWVRGTGLDAWIVQRERADLPLYVEMWLADAGLRGSPDYLRRYDEWLRWFESRGIEAMGFGWITLRRAERDAPEVRCEEFLGPVAGPIAPDVQAWAGAVDSLAADPLQTAWRVAPGVVQVTRGPVGADDPAIIELQRTQGLVRTRQVDTVEAGLASACDGDLPAGALLDALAQLLDRDAADLRATYAPRLVDLVLDGYLTPA